MLRFIFMRLLQAVPVLFIIATLTFFMVRLAPGGPFTEEKTIPKEIQQRIEEHYGLDRPLWEQYLLYFGILAKEVHKERVYFEPDEMAKEVVVKAANATLRVHRSGRVEELNGTGSWLSRLSPNVVVVGFQQEGEPAREVNQQPLTFKPGEQEQVLELTDATLRVDRFGTVKVVKGTGPWLARALPPEVIVYQKGKHSGLLLGELGPSFKYPDFTVEELIRRSFPISLQLGLTALVIALALGLPAGIIASLNKNSLLDYLPMSTAMMGICLPTFVMGPLLILIFSSGLGWFSPLGWYTWGDMVLPSLTLGLYYAAYIARLTRGGMLEVLNQDFIRTARAKGASERRVVLKHALKGGLLPVVSFLGPAFAGLISGSFIIETIFFIPGLGRFFVTAAFNRDYTMVIGTVLFYATLIILLNLLVDIVQAWLNPRTRLA